MGKSLCWSTTDPNTHNFVLFFTNFCNELFCILSCFDWFLWDSVAEQSEDNPANQSLDANALESKQFTISILLASGENQVQKIETLKFSSAYDNLKCLKVLVPLFKHYTLCFFSLI